jgi:hypothetical protein
VIPGAKKVGEVYKVHPFDLGEFLNQPPQSEVLITAYRDEAFTDAFGEEAVVKIGNDYYIQSVDVEPVTKNII